MRKHFFWNSHFPGNQHFMFFHTISRHNIWDFLEDLGKIIGAPFPKVAFSGGKVGGPLKSYISRRIAMSGHTPAEIGCLNTNLS